jgi:hypothetical protein
MGQTFLDQDIIPIGNFPRLESECEEAILDQFQVILGYNHFTLSWNSNIFSYCNSE